MFVCAMLFASLSALTNLSIPLILRIVIDNVLDDMPLQQGNFMVMWLVDLFGGVEGFRNNIWLAAAAHLVLAGIISIAIFGRQRSISNFGERTAKRMKDRLYNHIQSLPYSYHTHAKTGDLIQRCTSDVETTRRFLQVHTIEVARAIFFTTFALLIMFNINVGLTLVSLAFLPVIFVFSYVFFKHVRRVFKMADEKEGELTTVLQESVSGIRVVRAFGRGRFEAQKFVKENDEFKDLNFKQMKYLSWYWSLSDLLCFLQIATVFVVGIVFTYNGTLTTGELVLFNTNIAFMIWPIRQLGRTLSELGKMQVSLERVYEVLDTPAEEDTPGATPHDLGGDIVFKNVDFIYPDETSGRKIFDDISFEIKKGETIAILGGTGSGKSTLMHTLLRLYDYTGGSITINGKELRDISKEHLRENIGMVLQESFLYSKTIMANLQMAKDDVSESDVYDATKTAKAHGFIQGFEKGYDTVVGEKGVTLSGGQKQRVAIARTLIKDSQILIFDDSLSAVDAETDAQIREALSKRDDGITTFIISGRITTLMNADRIFVIEEGKLADIGTHAELLGREGLYKRIWDIQSMRELEM